MKYSIRQAFDELEQSMIKNIANSLLQIYFHQNATPEELQTYYGWKDAFKESERDGLIQDTLARVEAEQNILKFYKQNKTKIKNKYGDKNPIGDIGLPERRPAGGSAEPTSVNQDAEKASEEGPRQGADNEGGHAGTES